MLIWIPIIALGVALGYLLCQLLQEEPGFGLMVCLALGLMTVGWVRAMLLGPPHHPPGPLPGSRTPKTGKSERPP